MIYCVEDDASIRDIEVYALQASGFEAQGVEDGQKFYEILQKEEPQLVILDVMLPHKNGFEILRDMRKEKIETKVIMLTAKDMIEDKLNGLQNGANDYITKPFHIEELVARVNIQLRNVSENPIKDYIEFGDLKLNLK